MALNYDMSTYLMIGNVVANADNSVSSASHSCVTSNVTAVAVSDNVAPAVNPSRNHRSWKGLNVAAIPASLAANTRIYRAQ
jgi:hypothetical protein